MDINIGTVLEYLENQYEYMEYDLLQRHVEGADFICNGFKEAIKSIEERFCNEEDYDK